MYITECIRYDEVTFIYILMIEDKVSADSVCKKCWSA